MLIALAAVISFLNSFLGLGFLWIGKPGEEALVALLLVASGVFQLVRGVPHQAGVSD